VLLVRRLYPLDLSKGGRAVANVDNTPDGLPDRDRPECQTGWLGPYYSTTPPETVVMARFYELPAYTPDCFERIGWRLHWLKRALIPLRW
jgi:hypothetical protein